MGIAIAVLNSNRQSNDVFIREDSLLCAVANEEIHGLPRWRECETVMHSVLIKSLANPFLRNREHGRREAMCV